jgi:hypothetical protein
VSIKYYFVVSLLFITNFIVRGWALEEHPEAEFHPAKM